MKATGTYELKNWTEHPLIEITADKRTCKASTLFAIQGAIAGEARLEYLMFYTRYNAADPHASRAKYVGLIWFTGTVDGKSGSFAMEDDGIYENGTASSLLTIVPGSGTGEFQGIEGAGSYAADRDGTRIELDYSL